MLETNIAPESSVAGPVPPKSDAVADTSPDTEPRDGSFWRFLLLVAVAMLVLRSFIVSPFNIPSESMQPTLLIGDYLIVDKMAYGYSRYSLPFGVNLFSGRILSKIPERGDVVVFKAPPSNRDDYIKRVIGLPGDRIQMRNGWLFINDAPVKREHIGDAVIPVTDNMRAVAGAAPCFMPVFNAKGERGGDLCRYPRYRETLPNGVSYDTLDLISGDMDTTGVYTVPADHLFLMGDNRDRSADSRYPAVDGGGIGIVPMENLVGQARFIYFSTDGSASWINPFSWPGATRSDRIGMTL